MKRFIRNSLIVLCIMQPYAYAKTVEKTQVPLASVSAMVVDVKSGKTVVSKNSDQVMPIASVSKLMTAMVILDAKQPLDEKINIEISNVDKLPSTFSRVRLNSELTRKEALLLALMSSENRAAATLANHYPGGMSAFVKAMNAKAKQLGMTHSHFVEPTGLSEHNVSTAQDLVKMVKAASEYKLIHQFTTTEKKDTFFNKPRYALSFYNTNPLVKRDDWHIKVSKTGFTNEAGRCLVMLVTLNNQDLAFVFLDSFGKRSPVGDASRIRQWMETGQVAPVPKAAQQYAAQRLTKLN